VEGLGPAPAGDPCVVARPQHLGDGPAPELGGPGVLRVLEEPVGERLVVTRRLVPHHARHEATHGFQHDHGRHLPAVEHVVAHRELVVDQVAGHPGVDPFVPTTEQAEALAGREVPGQGLVEPTATRAEEEQGPGRVHGLDAGEHGLGHEDHARSAPERRVVHRPVRVPGLRAEVVGPHVEQAVPSRLAEQAGLREAVDQVGEDGEDVDAHGRRAFSHRRRGGPAAGRPPPPGAGRWHR
jgi:hypothetical protein